MSKKIQTDELQYPRFIPNRPCGIDKFSGGSQKRLAASIAKHLINNDKEGCMPRIIGLEGGWGSGKSNVVKQLQEVKGIKDRYHFFEYDAWGHQEDLQRRSLLELLTENLISNNILVGDTTVKIKGGETKTVTWGEKLKYLLARKTETENKTFPKLSEGTLAAFVVAVLTPIFTFISYIVRPEEPKWWFSIILVLIAGLPVIVSLILWRRLYKKDKVKYGLNYLLAIYQNRIENDITYETISESEPTVKEFKEWMTDISNTIGSETKPKLIIVFDNMDRLPAEKVKELWSSIHTFFAEDGFDNVWTIIPFDQGHLACAFGEEEDVKTIELTKYFISKTFPIVYRVSTPIVTDYKEIIDKLLLEAFGDIQGVEFSSVNRVYRLIRPNANVRDIIVFINELVALEQQWGSSEISLLIKTVYILNRDSFQKNPVEVILSGSYLDKIEDIVPNSVEVQEQVSSLVYGIEREHAKQIPLTKFLNECISSDKNLDVNKFAGNKNFNKVLEEVMLDLDDTQIDSAISVLDTLNGDAATRIDVLWTYLLKRRQPKSQNKQEFSDIDRILLMHIQPTTQQGLITKICKEIQGFEKFNGSDYWNSLSQLEQFIIENCSDCKIDLNDLEVAPDLFMSYVNNARENIKKYMLSTNMEELEVHIKSMLSTNFNFEIFQHLCDAGYEFPTLVSEIETNISNKTINAGNIYINFEIYKKIATTKPLMQLVDVIEATTIFNEFSESENKHKLLGYFDIVAMMLVHDQDVGDTSDETAEGVARVILYYVDNIQVLITSSSRSNIHLNKKIITYLINNKIPSALQASVIMANYANIKSAFSLSDDILLNYINDNNSEILADAITKENIQDVITVTDALSIFEATASIKNNLTAHINSKAVEALAEIPESTLYGNRTLYNSDYWFIVISQLMDTDHLREIPINLIELARYILRDIAMGSQSLPVVEPFNTLISKIDNREKTTVINEIIDSICNRKINITPQIFIYFENLFRNIGKLQLVPDDVVPTILQVVIIDANCKDLILDNMDYYSDIINRSKSNTDFKRTIQRMLESGTDERLMEFAKKIGVYIETSESEK